MTTPNPGKSPGLTRSIHDRVLGGVVAGGAGAIKVSRLRPAAALRSVD